MRAFADIPEIFEEFRKETTGGCVCQLVEWETSHDMFNVVRGDAFLKVFRYCNECRRLCTRRLTR